MKWAAGLGAIGLIFHPGVHGGVGCEADLHQTEEVIQVVLDTTPERSVPAVKSTAGLAQNI